MNDLRHHLAKLAEEEEAVRIARTIVDARKREIGLAMRRAREAKGLTQTDVAGACSMSKAMLSDFEYGRRWSDRLVAELRKVLKV